LNFDSSICAAEKNRTGVTTVFFPFFQFFTVRSALTLPAFIMIRPKAPKKNLTTKSQTLYNRPR
jgi:hypothetical protein